MPTKKTVTAESLWRDYQATVRKANQAAAVKVKTASERYRKGMDKLDKAAKPKQKAKSNV